MALRETLDKIRSGGTPANEEAAKFQIIAPILRDLGWDPFGPDVLYEHSVGGGEGGSVDIALQGPRDLVALIEAKAPGINLRKHVSQVLRYAHYEGVDICVLTNGLEWWLYLPLDKGAPEKRRFTTLHIKEDPIEQLADDFETFLGEKNLVDGQAQRRAKQVLEASQQAAFLGNELPGVWQTMLDGPDDDLVELVRQRTYEKVNIRPDREQVAAMLNYSPAPPVVPDGPAPPIPTPPKMVKPTGFRLWGRHYDVKHGTEVYTQTAGLLYQRYGQEFINRLLCLQTTGGKAYASRQDSHDEHLFRSKKIPGTNNIYLDTNLKIKDLEKRAHEFLKLFGHPPSDLEIFYV